MQRAPLPRRAHGRTRIRSLGDVERLRAEQGKLPVMTAEKIAVAGAGAADDPLGVVGVVAAADDPLGGVGVVAADDDPLGGDDASLDGDNDSLGVDGDSLGGVAGVAGISVVVAAC